MSALLWLAKLPAPLRGLLALAVAFLLGWGTLAVHDRTQRAIGRAEAATARARQDAQRWQQIAATADARQARVDTVWRAATPRYAAVRDSSKHLAAQLDTAQTDRAVHLLLAQQGRALDAADTVIAACALARLTCEQRVAARDSVIAALRAQRAAVASTPRPRRRCGPGAALGVGATVDSRTHAVATGPSATAGLSCSF